MASNIDLKKNKVKFAKALEKLLKGIKGKEELETSFWRT